MGAEGFRWFIGIVEDREDPLKLGRVRVRAHQIHDDKANIPTDDLPWAFIMVPPFSASIGEIGISPVGLMVGSTVVGFFVDGHEAQLPIILGSMHGIPEDHDVTRLAREVQSLAKEPLGPEPSSAYAAKYPFNKVFQSETGHAFEVDDTPGAERLHLYHKTGTYVEINSRGQRVTKVVNDDYEIVAGKKEVFIKGNVNIVVKGNVTMQVDGNMDTHVNGTYTCVSDGTMTFKGSTINLN